MEVASGQRIGQGRFEVLARLGEGGAGVVYEVKDHQSDARLALKTVRAVGPEALVSLKREFRAVQDITHPNLVRLDELFEEDGAWFFTMELVDGTDWLSYVRTARGYDAARIRATLPQIVDALGVLHATGTMHRDVKPSNVLVSRDGHVKLLDFGIAARERNADAAFDGIVGTLAYMPPEQLLAEKPLPASDFYAMGVMLHEALTGHLPYFDMRGAPSQLKVAMPPSPVRMNAPDAPDDLATLCDALLRLDPHDRPDAAAILRVLGAHAATTSGDMPAAKEEFVGRAKELAEMGAAFHEVRKGGTVTVFVEGASGVGKSALVQHFLDAVSEQALVLHGRCHEREYVPYKGIDAIVDELAAYLAADDDVLCTLHNSAMRLLPRLFPVLDRVPFFAGLHAGSLAIPEGDAFELRARIFGAFRELVTRVAETRTLVLAIDDIQWADGDTLALLGDLVAPPSPPRILLLCTHRFVDPDERETATPPIAPPGDVRRIPIEGLNAEESAALASRLSTAGALKGEELTALAQESGGHPLFLQELMRRRARGKSDAPGVPAPPLRLDDALWSRVSLLGEEERRIVEAIAVAGFPTSIDLIAQAAAIPRRDLAQLMATLRTAKLVKVSGASASRRIEPYHDRVREAVVLHLDGEARTRWHERLARAIEASAERDVERLAVHWEAAGDAARAAALFREAGERASSALAFDRAVEFYRRSLALYGAKAPGDRADLEYALADALFNAGRGDEAGKAFMALAARAENDGLHHEGDRRALAMRVRAATAYFGTGYFNEGIDAIRSVLESANLPFYTGRFAILFSILWYRLILKFRGLVLKEAYSGERLAREKTRFDICTAAAFGIGMADTLRGGVYQYLGAILALRTGDPRRAVRGLCGFSLTLCIGGLKTAKWNAEVLDEARRLSESIDDPYSSALVEGVSGFGAFMIEEYARAAALLSKAEVLFRDIRGVTFELDTVRMMHGRALSHLGRLTELDAYMGSPLRDAIRRNDVYAKVNTQTTVGAFLAVARDDEGAAERLIADSMRTIASYRYQMQHFYCMNALCIVDTYRDEPHKVLARLEEHRLALKRALFERVQSVRVMLVNLRARAHLGMAAKMAESSERRDHVARASACAKALAKEGLPGAAVLACILQASVARVRGDTARAVSVLRAAIALCDAREMILHAASARHTLAPLVGGDEGAALASDARAFFEAQRIKAPDKLVRLYVPAFTP